MKRRNWWAIAGGAAASAAAVAVAYYMIKKNRKKNATKSLGAIPERAAEQDQSESQNDPQSQGTTEEEVEQALAKLIHEFRTLFVELRHPQTNYSDEKTLIKMSRMEDVMAKIEEISGRSGLMMLREAVEHDATSVSNLQLAHDLIRNKNFRVGQSGMRVGTMEDQMYNNIKQIAKRAFWDIVRADLALSPPDFTRVTIHLQEIKDELIRFTPHQAHMRTEIEEHMDIDLIKQQIANHTFDTPTVLGLFDFVVNRIMMLEAPARSEDTNTRAADLRTQLASQGVSSTIVKMMEFIFDKFDEIRTDLTNFKLQQVGNQLRQDSSHSYEREKLGEQIEQGLVKLDRTKEIIESLLIRETVQNGDAPSPSPVDLVALHRGDAAAYETLICLVILDSLKSTSAASVHTAPELLRLDIEQLVAFQNTIQMVSLLGVQCTLIGQMLASKSVPVSAAALPRIVDHLKEQLRSPVASLSQLTQRLVADVRDLFVMAHKEFTPVDESMLDGMVKRTTNFNDPVFQVFYKRVIAVIARALREGPAVVGADSLGAGSPFLSLVAGDLKDLVVQIHSFCRHHVKVFAPFWNRSIKEVLETLDRAANGPQSASESA